MTGRSRLTVDADRPLRHAVEIRHSSFMTEDFVSLLRKHDIGLVVADTAGKWPRMFDVTSDFVYVRLHGDAKIYTSGYSARALAGWARRIRRWAQDDLDVYVYFDNDVKVRAPFDALNLMRKLRLDWGHPVHQPGTRVPRLKYAYGPRVSGGNPAWDGLTRSRTRTAGTRASRSTTAYGAKAPGGSASAGAGRR
jgi:hypothetical protein